MKIRAIENLTLGHLQVFMVLVSAGNFLKLFLSWPIFKRNKGQNFKKKIWNTSIGKEYNTQTKIWDRHNHSAYKLLCESLFR